MSFPFENLDVYQRSLDFVDKVDQLHQRFEGKVSRDFFSQLSRASISIPLNIAEGNGRWHKADKRNFFWIARGSTFECVPLLEILRRRGLLSEADARSFKDHLTVIGKMLTNLVKAHE